jgi:ABC-type uncharacterized transport system permease subunit
MHISAADLWIAMFSGNAQIPKRPNSAIATQSTSASHFEHQPTRELAAVFFKIKIVEVSLIVSVRFLVTCMS